MPTTFYLYVEDCDALYHRAIESYKKAFGATESFRMPDATAQRVGHAEFTIGDSARAVARGAKLVEPIKDQDYRDSSGTIHDPFGHVWTVATHTRDVSGEEMMARSGGSSENESTTQAGQSTSSVPPCCFAPQLIPSLAGRSGIAPATISQIAAKGIHFFNGSCGYSFSEFLSA